MTPQVFDGTVLLRTVPGNISNNGGTNLVVFSSDHDRTLYAFDAQFQLIAYSLS